MFEWTFRYKNKRGFKNVRNVTCALLMKSELIMELGMLSKLVSLLRTLTD